MLLDRSAAQGQLSSLVQTDALAWLCGAVYCYQGSLECSFQVLLPIEVAVEVVSDLSGCVQRPGVRFTWLLDGGEGSREIARHLHGFRHVH